MLGMHGGCVWLVFHVEIQFLFLRHSSLGAMHMSLICGEQEESRVNQGTQSPNKKMYLQTLS